MKLFYPTMLKNRITDITDDDLHCFGARALLLDVDNTLTTHDSQQLSPEVRDWLTAREAAGFALILVSNAPEKRVQPFAERIGLPYVYRAAKPLPIGFRRAMKRLGLSRRECMVIGDQSLTDVLGARLGGMPCIQLMPIEEERGKPFLQWKRRVERVILKRYRRGKDCL